MACLAPPLLQGDILNDTESLTGICKLIRSYYDFAPSESSFLKFATIKRELNGTELERAAASLPSWTSSIYKDNLLKNDSNIQHDGKVLENDEKHESDN